jgi:hypothetical protein
MSAKLRHRKKRDLYFEVAAEHSVGLQYITILEPLKEHNRYHNFRARSLPKIGVVMSQKPNTISRLWRFLHECGHCKLHSNLRRSVDVAYHSIELEAERYAYDAIKSAGIEVSAKALRDSQDYISGELMADARAGFQPAEGVFEYLSLFEDESSDYYVADYLRDRVAEILSGPRTVEHLAAWYHNNDHPILNQYDDEEAA